MGDRAWWKAKLHQGGSPFENVEGEAPPDYWNIFGGWNSVFKEIVRKEQPREIIEVGSWLGRSAIEMSSQQKALGIPDAVTVCVDTWTGYPQWREWKDAPEPWKSYLFRSLRLKNGFSQMYETFARAVVHHGIQDIVVPFPATSVQAWEWMKVEKVCPDLVYIDGDHSELQTYQDITNFFELVRPGGLLVGDDYEDPTWAGVTNAVNRFKSERGLPVEFFQDDNRKYRRYWMLRKP